MMMSCNTSAIALLSVFAVVVPSRAGDAQPNIVLILADDFGYECLTANGGQSYHTPRLDKLAASGMRFEGCHVQPLCTPTRVQLMTALYNVRNYYSFGEIDRRTTTFAHLLKKAGYATAIAGKWQLGREKKLPQQLGFDQAYLWQHMRRPSRYPNPGLEMNGEERNFTNGEYGPDLINDFALDFITRHKDGPFFLYYPMMLTHGPFQPTPDSPDWDPQARDERSGKNPKHFADMTAYMDKLVGSIADKLDELGIRENTLVIFLGDNGTGRQITSKFKGQVYPGGKGDTTVRGTHVPLIVSWPRKVAAGAVNSGLISSTDFLPTICEAAHAKLPDSMPQDGQSFLPQLLGQKGSPREWLYSWYARGAGLKNLRQSVMTKQYKLYRGGRFFDLVADPFEEHPKRIGELSGAEAEAARKLTDVFDQYADARPPDVSAAAANAPAEGEEDSDRPRKPRARRRKSADAASVQTFATRDPA